MNKRDVPTSGSPRSAESALWRAALAMPLTGWLFLGLAVVDLAGWIYFITQSFDGSQDLALQGARSVAIVLLPAALFYGAQAAVRANRLLVGGIAALAVLEVARTATLVYGMSFLSNLDDVTAFNTVALTISALTAAAYVVYAIGLLRMRQRPMSRLARLLGPAIVLLQLAAGVGIWFPFVAPAPDSVPLINWLSTGAMDLTALTGGSVVWVAVSAWVDREEPRDFWRVLALAGLTGVTASVLATVEFRADYAGALDPDIANALSILVAAGLLAAAIGAIAAFGWAFGVRRPGMPEPSSAVPTIPASI